MASKQRKSQLARKGKAAAVAAPLAAMAAEALKDPVRREKLIRQGRDLADAARRRIAQHDGDLEPGALKSRINKRARRINRLQEGINGAALRDPALLTGVGPLLDRLDRVRSQVAVADTVSKTNRRAFHERIDADLDEIERDLADALGLGRTATP